MKKLLILSVLLPTFAFAGVDYISEADGDSTNLTYHVKCTDGNWGWVKVTDSKLYAISKIGYIGDYIGVSEAARRACQ